MNKFNCILFDLDGTLIDTTPLIYESFRYTLLHHIQKAPRDEELVKFLGIPLRKAFEDTYPESAELMMKTYREINETYHDHYTGVFIGVEALLVKCREKGVRLGVVTSKRRELAMRGMKLFGLDTYLDVFVGLEDTTIHKPQAEPVLKALELLGLTGKDNVVYVGDSIYDIQCAKAAGVHSAAVGWSYFPPEELKVLKPDLFLESPLELLQYI